MPDWRACRRTAKFIWKKAVATGGLAGLSVSDGRLILAERDFAEEHDVYRCLNADNGELLWAWNFPRAAPLDYGQSPGHAGHSCRQKH